MRRSISRYLAFGLALLVVESAAQTQSFAELRRPPGASRWGFGVQTVTLGDLDGDRVPELVVTWLRGRTLAAVFSGRTLDHLVTVPWPDEAFQDGLDSLGFVDAAAGLGDLDGDGRPDFAIGASLSIEREDAGRVYLVSGGTGEILRTLRSPSPRPFGYFGQAVAALGDVNGNGVPDLAVGAMGEYDGRGRVYVFDGVLEEALHVLDGPETNDPHLGTRFGQALAALGDVNGDGIVDFGVGAEYEARGTITVFDGASGAPLYKATPPSSAAAPGFGFSLSGTGDLDRDGIPDLIAGAFRTNSGRPGAGRAFVFSGRTGALLFQIDPPQPSQNASFGWAVSGAHDIDFDEVPDLVVSAPRFQTTGIVYLISGRDGRVLDHIESLYPAGYGWFGYDLEAVTAEGLDTIVIGARGEEEAAGRVYLLTYWTQPDVPPDLEPFAAGFAYPNPTRGRLHVAVAAPSAERYRFSAWDLRGRRVRDWVFDRSEEGRAILDLDLSGLPAGVYFLRMEAPVRQPIQQITLLR